MTVFAMSVGAPLAALTIGTATASADTSTQQSHQPGISVLYNGAAVGIGNGHRYHRAAQPQHRSGD